MSAGDENAPDSGLGLAALKAMIDEVNLRLDEMQARLAAVASPANVPGERLAQIERALITGSAVIGEIQPHFAKSDITGPQEVLRDRMVPIKARHVEGAPEESPT